MNFAFPSFLWALFALAIPILIHLFNFRRTTRIYFSTTRFLHQVRQETTQQRKLKQYLVLASRLLFLFFLVLAFAQPFLPAREQLTAGRDVTVYLDNSYSMLSQTADKTRALDAGIRFIQEIVTLFPPDTRYHFITNDFAPSANSYKTKTEVQDLLTQVRLSPVSRTFREVQQRIGTNDREVFWIADFQKSTFGIDNPPVPDSLVSWRLVPITHNDASNILIDSVYLEDPFVVGGQRNTLNVRLRNVGPRTREGLVLKLTVNDVQSGTAAVNLESNSTAMARFDLVQGLSGWNKAVLSFTDFPVSFDNEFYTTLNFSEKIRIVAIGNDTYLQKVYGNNALFTVQHFAPGNVDVGLLNQADLVIVNGVDIDTPLRDILLNYQQGSGSLLIVPSAQPNVATLQSLVPGLVLTKGTGRELADLDKPDFRNPFFENVFEERSPSMSMPRARAVLDWGVDRSALLAFKDGKGFLARVKNTYLLASPLDAAFTDMQTHGVFLPVMYRMAASSHRISQKSYYTLSENTIVLQADSLDGEVPVRLTGKQEIIPSQRRSIDRVVMELPKFSIDPGFYYATMRQDTVGLIAFDLDKRESLLDQYSGEEVKQQLGGGKNISLFDSAATDSFSNEIKERYLGTPLWKWALGLALLFLLAEVLLIRFLK